MSLLARGPFGGSTAKARRSVELGPVCGMRPRRRAGAREDVSARSGRFRVAPTGTPAGTAPPSAGRVVGRRIDRDIDIALEAAV